MANVMNSDLILENDIILYIAPLVSVKPLNGKFDD
jgi:hypothetical protein